MAERRAGPTDPHAHEHRSSLGLYGFGPTLPGRKGQRTERLTNQWPANWIPPSRPRTAQNGTEEPLAGLGDFREHDGWHSSNSTRGREREREREREGEGGREAKEGERCDVRECGGSRTSWTPQNGVRERKPGAVPKFGSGRAKGGEARRGEANSGERTRRAVEARSRIRDEYMLGWGG